VLYWFFLGGQQRSDVGTLLVGVVLVGFGWPTVERCRDIGSCCCIDWVSVANSGVLRGHL